MGEKSDLKLMYSLDGNEFKVSELEVANLYDARNDFNRFLDQEFKINLALLTFLQSKNKGLYFLNIIGAKPTKENIVKYRHILQKISPNNWLRRHGIPMRRKAHLKRRKTLYGNHNKKSMR